LKGEFKFCSINDNTATLSNSFKCNSPTDDVVPLKIEKSYIALVEDHYQVNFEAWKCLVTKKTYMTYQYLFAGNQDYPPELTNIQLNPVDCQSMVLSKICYGNKMKKYNSNEKSKAYVFYGKPNLTYHIWYHKTFQIHECFFDTIRLKSTSITETLFPDAPMHCPASLNHCFYNDYTYIWSYVLQKCKYLYVKDFLMKGTPSNDNIYHLNVRTPLSTNIKVTMKVNGEQQSCNSLIYETTIGLYLTNSENKHHFELTDLTAEIQRSLLTADIDSKLFSIDENLKKTQTIISASICGLYKNLITTAKLSWPKNRFYSIFDGKNHELVVYNDQNTNEFLIAKCHIVQNPEIIEEKMCYQSFKVQFQIKNKSVVGFLSHDNILIANSNIVDCANKIVTRLNSNYQLIRSYNKIQIVFNNNNSQDIIQLKFNNTVINFDHLNEIFTSTENDVEKIASYLIDLELNRHSVYKQDNTFFSSLSNVVHNVKNGFLYVIALIYEEILVIMYFCFGILAIILIIVFCLWIVKILIKRALKKKRINRNNRKLDKLTKGNF